MDLLLIDQSNVSQMGFVQCEEIVSCSIVLSSILAIFHLDVNNLLLLDVQSFFFVFYF